MNRPILEAKGICKRFPGVVALDNVSLEIYPREVLGLVGENGAGKSTLMKIIGGIYQPNEGRIFIDESPVRISSVTDAINHRIGLIHQELEVLDNLDVAGNVFLGREPTVGGPLKLVNRRRIAADTQKYLAPLGLNVSPWTPLSELSIAQRQMVEIAKALSLNARILMMDEPTSALTVNETARLLEIIRELRSKGVTIIFISHRIEEVKQCADRVVVLRDGANAGQLTGDDITHDKMIRLMVGRDLDKFFTRASGREQTGYFRVRDFRTTYRPRHKIDFDISRGEIFGFAGLVGAGRSELAQAIFGVDRKVSGRILLEGRELKIRSPRDAVNNGVYLIPEDRHRAGLVQGMSVRENITLPSLGDCATLGLVNNGAERRVASGQCESLNIRTPSVETNVMNLSGGNQQKVILAKWLALKPKVLIFDEPTRGIDVGAKSEIYKLMRDLAEAGVVIMMISSDMEEILGVSSRIAVMHEGMITGILHREHCTEEKIMQLALGRIENHTLQEQGR